MIVSKWKSDSDEVYYEYEYMEVTDDSGDRYKVFMIGEEGDELHIHIGNVRIEIDTDVFIRIMKEVDDRYNYLNC